MRKVHLLTTVAASLLLAASATAAENNIQKGKGEMANPAPAAQRQAPPEKVAPSMHAGQKKPETTGHAGASDKGSAELKSGRRETTGQAPKASDTSKARMNEKSSGKAQMNESKSGAGVKENNETKSGASSGASQQSSQSVNGKASTTGQGAAAGAANLSTAQRTKITTILKQHKVQPTHLNISVRVGATVPTSVHFYPLPTEVIDIYPEWRGYDYILVGDEIIIINPRSHMIVAVLET